MLRTMSHPTPTFGEPHRGCAQRTIPSYGPIAITLGIIRDGLRDGLAAQRRYQQLTSSGVARDPALRAALGCGAVQSHPCNQARSHGHD
jgi:hypothetical protein